MKPIPISRTLAGTVICTVLAVGLLLASPALAVSGSTAKMAASTGFLATALAAGALRTPYGRLIFAALALCWWGDYFLTRSREIDFLFGLGAFLLGHMGFAGAFLLHGVNPRWSIAAGLATLPAALLVYAWLEAQFGSMMLPVCAYITIISLMLALAIGTRGRKATPLILIGAALFYASDLFVARQKFSVHSPWNPLIGLPLYYAAQLCLALSITSLRPHRP